VQRPGKHWVIVPAAGSSRRLASSGPPKQYLQLAGRSVIEWALAPFLELSIPFAGVFGRNDGDREGLRAFAAKGVGIELYESPHSLEVGGRRILLVHDLGEALGCGAVLTALRRTRSGEFGIEPAVPLVDVLQAGREALRLATRVASAIEEAV